MPRAGSYWGEEIPARGDVRIPKEKGYPAGAQNSIAISGAIFSLICNLNKDQFMALLLQALFFIDRVNTGSRCGWLLFSP